MVTLMDIQMPEMNGLDARIVMTAMIVRCRMTSFDPEAVGGTASHWPIGLARSTCSSCGAESTPQTHSPPI
jgi:hypothetical protein